MSREDGVFAKSLINPPVIITTICALTSIILAFIFCTFYLMPEFGHRIVQFYFLYLIMSKLLAKPNTKKIKNIYYQQKQSIGDIRADGGVQVQSNVQCQKQKTHQSNVKKSINTVQQQPKRKPKMSSSGRKEKEKLFLESRAIQLLSQIYDVTKSLLNETREVIKKFDQNKETSKNSTECFSTELEALQKQKESQSLLPDNLSHGEAPESLKGTQACINQRNSHGSNSTNTLDSKAGEQINDDVDVPKEIASLLKNKSLCHITYHFNEIQSPTELSEKPLKDASNTNSDSNISTRTDPFTLLITLALNFFLTLHGYGVNLFLYFPFINDYSRILSHQKISKCKAETLYTNNIVGNTKTKCEQNQNSHSKGEAASKEAGSNDSAENQ